MLSFLYKNVIHLLIAILFLGSTAHAVMPAVSTQDFEFGACGSQMSQSVDGDADKHSTPPCCAEKTDTAVQPLIQQTVDGHALVMPLSASEFAFFEYQFVQRNSLAHNNSHQKYVVLRI